MAWVLLDDLMPDHPKIVAAEVLDDRAPWLFVCALTYCRRYLTGGLIPTAVIPTLVRKYRPAMSKALLQVCLLEPATEHALTIHDYDDWNAGEDEQRVARSEKARRAAQARWNKGNGDG